MPIIFIIPTGIACEIGGYAGDGLPAARLLSEASGCLITHPNVMNGASLYWRSDKIFYVEGYSLNKFALGELVLRPIKSQRIGILFDSAIEEDLKNMHLNVINSCKYTLGIDINSIVFTEEKLNIELTKSSSGTSAGRITSVEVLSNAAQKLLNNGSTAIAIITRFPDSHDAAELADYRQGCGVDPISGTESMISHFISHTFNVPCAHSPALRPISVSAGIDPRSAAEEIGYTFLPSVLVGLNKAPNLIKKEENTSFINHHQEIIDISHIGALVIPDGALGNECVFSCIENNIPIIVVKNKNLLNITSDVLQIKNIIKVDNYIEAAGIVLALKNGISIDSLRRPVEAVKSSI
tara:strand:- start:18294 stop:19349 length:1056 start_codon:yes stop_codon:yes gene_type:complete